jgi:hypothetical protein
LRVWSWWMIVNFRRISGILILNTLGRVPRQGFFLNFFQGLGGLGFRSRVWLRPGSLPPGARKVLPGQGPARQAHSLETDRHFWTPEASRIIAGGTSHRCSGKRGFRPGKGRRRCRNVEFQHPAGVLVMGDTHPVVPARCARSTTGYDPLSLRDSDSGDLRSHRCLDLHPAIGGSRLLRSVASRSAPAGCMRGRRLSAVILNPVRWTSGW